MKKLIFVILLFSLFLPKIQEHLEILKVKKLSGIIPETPKSEFTFDRWMSGKFQNDYTEYKDATFGLRNFFVRLYNQCDFSLFKKTHCDVIVGQKDYLYQGGYINEVTGLSFIGDEAMRLHLEKMHKIQTYLDEKNIYLLNVLAPGKSDYFQEYLPEYYLKRVSSNTNYNTILKYSKSENIRLLDLNKYFLQMKDTCTYPLFPIQGIHWNFYGVALATDTIAKYIEVDKNIRLPKITWKLELSETLQGTDYDLGDLLNIYEKLPAPKMAYPNFTITEDSSTVRPRLLVIGDSFYWAIFNEGVFGKVFKDQTYYYYCHNIYPEDFTQSSFPSDLDIVKEVEKYDVILLMQSSGNYNNPGVNFMQIMTSELKLREDYRMKVNDQIQKIESLSNLVTQISSEKKISKDSASVILSDSLVDNRFAQISKIKLRMRHNKEWLAQLNQKSAEANKSLDEVMQSDAQWMVDQDEIKAGR